MQPLFIGGVEGVPHQRFVCFPLFHPWINSHWNRLRWMSRIICTCCQSRWIVTDLMWAHIIGRSTWYFVRWGHPEPSRRSWRSVEWSWQVGPTKGRSVDRDFVRWAHQPCSIAVPICHGVCLVFIFGLVLLVGPWILVPLSFTLEQKHKCDLRVEMVLNVLP